MAGVVQHSEVRVVPLHTDFIDQCEDLARLVDREARFEFPTDADVFLRGQFAAKVERFHGPGEREFVADLAGLNDRDWFDGIDADAVDPQIVGEHDVLGEGCDERPTILHRQHFLAPKIGGERREIQAMGFNIFAEFVSALFGGVAIRAGVRAETAEFDAVVAKVLELVQDCVEVVGRHFLIEDVGPSTDGDACFWHRETSRGRGTQQDLFLLYATFLRRPLLKN